MNSLKVFKLRPDAILPERKTEESVGYDLYTTEGFTLYTGERYLVSTGLCVQPPAGYHTEIILRSGMASKHNIVLVNSVGVIDRDYAGPNDELKVLLYKLPWFGLSRELTEPVTFKSGDRVAQLLIRKSYTFDVKEVFSAPGSDDRGGFGSTGS